MARFILLISAWKKHTKENWVTLVRMIHRETRNEKGKEDPTVES